MERQETNKGNGNNDIWSNDSAFWRGGRWGRRSVKPGGETELEGDRVKKKREVVERKDSSQRCWGGGSAALASPCRTSACLRWNEDGGGGPQRRDTTDVQGN